jgi:hypothetical protein
MKQYINPILRVASIVMLLYIIYNQHNTINKLQSNRPTTDSITQVCDSLKMEISSKDIEIGRYEIIFDRAEGEMSPECKTELETIKHTVE